MRPLSECAPGSDATTEAGEEPVSSKIEPTYRDEKPARAGEWTTACDARGMRRYGKTMSSDDCATAPRHAPMHPEEGATPSGEEQTCRNERTPRSDGRAP